MSRKFYPICEIIFPDTASHHRSVPFCFFPASYLSAFAAPFLSDLQADKSGFSQQRKSPYQSWHPVFCQSDAVHSDCNVGVRSSSGTHADGICHGLWRSPASLQLAVSVQNLLRSLCPDTNCRAVHRTSLFRRSHCRFHGCCGNHLLHLPESGRKKTPLSTDKLGNRKPNLLKSNLLKR